MHACSLLLISNFVLSRAVKMMSFRRNYEKWGMYRKGGNKHTYRFGIPFFSFNFLISRRVSIVLIPG